MPRGIPWDDLTLFREKKVAVALINDAADLEIEPRDFQKDAWNIGKRGAFGLVCGSMTGIAFGTVDILRDPKSMTAKKAVATAKVLKYGALFGGFFATYHGVRKTMSLYNPQPPEINVITSAAISLTPLLFVPSMRPLIPYGVMLIGLDAINGLDDL